MDSIPNTLLAGLLGVIAVCAAIAILVAILRWMIGVNGDGEGSTARVRTRIYNVLGVVLGAGLLAGGSETILTVFRDGEIVNNSNGTSKWGVAGSGTSSATLGDFITSASNSSAASSASDLIAAANGDTEAASRYFSGVAERTMSNIIPSYASGFLNPLSRIVPGGSTTLAIVDGISREAGYTQKGLTALDKATTKQESTKSSLESITRYLERKVNDASN